jgi:hypothetical protein
MIKIAVFILLALELWFSDFGSCAKSRSFSLFKSTQVAPRTTKTSPKPTTFYSGARLDNLERLQKVISRAGVTSRRDAEKLVSMNSFHCLFRFSPVVIDGLNCRYWREELL